MLFFLFTYNSSLGFDALEHLTIGRALLDGYPLYSFITSKSWAMYYFSAGVVAASGGTHIGIAAVIAITFALTVLGTYLVGRALFTKRAGTIAAALIALCAPCMELNFLLPEPWVLLTGLPAAFCLAQARVRGLGRLAAASGACIGLGFAFKPTAAFYLLAAILWLVSSPSAARTRGSTTRQVIGLLAGFAVCSVVPGLFFYLTGQLSTHVLWTYLFPVLYYPPSTLHIRTLFTKELWFVVLVLTTVALSAMKRWRAEVYGNHAARLVLLLGAVPMLGLVKSQTGHFMYPGAGFLCMYIGFAIDIMLPRLAHIRRGVIPAFLAGAIICGGALLAYRPGVLRRFTSISDFREEETWRKEIQALVPENRRVLFMTGIRLYWVSRRYPNVPFLDSDLQTTWFVSRHPNVLLAALADPRLILVDFDVNSPSFDDPRFLNDPCNRATIESFSTELVRRFEPISTESGLRLWRRRNVP